MLFDAQIAPAQIEISTLEEQEQVQVALALAIMVPVSAQQAMALPLGVTRFGLTKEDALKHGQALIDAANTLPDPKPESDLVIAQSLAGVDQAVQQADKLIGKSK